MASSLKFLPLKNLFEQKTFKWHYFENNMIENIKIIFENKIDISVLDKNFYLEFLNNIRKIKNSQ